MRFKRYGRHSFQDTPRKRAALTRKQRAERDALPLFAEQVAADQLDADTVMDERARRWAETEMRWRAQRAADWRRARAKLSSYPEPERRALHDYWQRCGWPADPNYLISMLHMFDTGRLEAVTALLA